MGVIQAIASRNNHHRQRRWFWDDNKIKTLTTSKLITRACAQLYILFAHVLIQSKPQFAHP